MTKPKQYTHIEVTQRDIDRADIKKSGTCAVSTALARCIPGAMRIETDVQTIRFTLNGERYVYVTPYAVSGYVIAFDRGDEILPFTFRLSENNRVGVRRRVKTDAGKAVDAAQQKVRDRKKLVETLEAGLAGKPAERKKAKKAVADATADLASITAAYEGAVQTQTLPGERKAPPRVYRTGRRTYGNRVLAINQAPAQ